MSDWEYIQSLLDTIDAQQATIKRQAQLLAMQEAAGEVPDIANIK